jgi:hypothetical protein
LAQNKPKPHPKPKPKSRPIVQQVREVTKTVLPGKEAKREIDYYPVDPQTKQIQYSGHTLVLSEQLVGTAPPQLPGICNPPCSQTNEFEDSNTVFVHDPYSVERRWSVGSGQGAAVPAGVLAPDGKVYDFEVLHLSVEPGVKEPFQMEYKNDPNE